MRLTILLVPLILVFLSCEIKQNSPENSSNIIISIIEPENGSIISDTMLIECATSNDKSIVKVELWFDGDSTAIQDLSIPFTLILDSRNYENGFHNFFVKAYDNQGNIYDSETITIKIHNFFVFSKTYGAENINEIGRSILQNSDSSFIILGGVGDDILLYKSDRQGNIEWEQSFGGSQMDEANHITKTTDGGYIISGTTKSYGLGGSDIWLIKTDISGSIEWNTYLGTTHDDHAGKVIETSDGGFLIIGDKHNIENGHNDIWLIKTNSQGDSLWTKTYGDEESDYGADLLAHEDGGFIILGSTESTGNGGKDIWIIKIDTDGNEEWNKTYGDGSNDMGQSIIKTYDNGFIIRYVIQSYGQGNTSVGLLRLSANGDQLWTKTIGGSNGISGSSIQRIGDDEYIMACSLFDNGENTYDAYMIKINDSGDILWDATFGAQENDHGMGIIKTLDNGFIIIGSTNNFGNGNKNSSDVWIIKTNSNGFTTSFEFYGI
ncbi:MAG: Ig-like domain-containing protein [Candidatus Neomarinimicrobiota bacterium]